MSDISNEQAKTLSHLQHNEAVYVRLEAEMRDQLSTLTRERDEARRERDLLSATVGCYKAPIQAAIEAMGNGADEDRWPSGTHVVIALIAERDQLKARAEKAEGDARWFVKYGRPWAEYAAEWNGRAKPYEEKQP